MADLSVEQIRKAQQVIKEEHCLMNESYKNNQTCERDERVIRYNMEKCASFMARMILKYGKEVLEEIEAENEKTNVSNNDEKN